jgi:hypothetical protein
MWYVACCGGQFRAALPEASQAMAMSSMRNSDVDKKPPRRLQDN